MPASFSYTQQLPLPPYSSYQYTHYLYMAVLAILTVKVTTYSYSTNLLLLGSITHFISKATPTNNTDYSCLIKAVEID